MTVPHWIATVRLALRPVSPDDEAPVLAGLNHFEVAGWLARVPFPYTSTDFFEFLSGFARAGETFAVDDQEGFAGVVTGGAELGYWFLPRAQGRGYATEAADAVLRAWFSAGGGDVGSGYFEGNTRSARVLAKLGFVETGRTLIHCRATDGYRPHVALRLTTGAFAARPIRGAFGAIPVGGLSLRAL